jgi:hypothetical protein
VHNAYLMATLRQPPQTNTLPILLGVGIYSEDQHTITRERSYFFAQIRKGEGKDFQDARHDILIWLAAHHPDFEWVMMHLDSRDRSFYYQLLQKPSPGGVR